MASSVLDNHVRFFTGDGDCVKLKVGAWVTLQGGRSGMGGRGRGDGGRGNGRMSTGLRPVDEGTRIDLANLLDEFQHSDDTGNRRYGVVAAAWWGQA